MLVNGTPAQTESIERKWQEKGEKSVTDMVVSGHNCGGIGRYIFSIGRLMVAQFCGMYL